MTLESVKSLQSSPVRELKLAILDMAGTTVADDGLVEQAFSCAVASEGIEPGGDRFSSMLGYVRDTMGISKITVFMHLFNGDRVRAERANHAFELAYDSLVADGGLTAIPGAEDAIGWLRDAGMKVCLTTGFARHTQNIILESLGWMGLADLSLCPSDAGRGRPYPDMILTAVLALDMDDVRETVVVGDTTADVQAGLRSGASMVLGVLTGAHQEPALRAAGAMAVIPSVASLPQIVPAMVPARRQ